MSRKPLRFNLTADEIDKIYYAINNDESNSVYVKRCLIILMTENGVTLNTIASLVKVSKATANKWRQAFLLGRWDALQPKKVGRPLKKLRRSTTRYAVI